MKRKDLFVCKSKTNPDQTLIFKVALKGTERSDCIKPA